MILISKMEGGDSFSPICPMSLTSGSLPPQPQYLQSTCLWSPPTMTTTSRAPPLPSPTASTSPPTSRASHNTYTPISPSQLSRTQSPPSPTSTSSTGQQQQQSGMELRDRVIVVKSHSTEYQERCNDLITGQSILKSSCCYTFCIPAAKFSNRAVIHLASDLCVESADVLDGIIENQEGLPKSTHWRLLNPLMHRTQPEMIEAGMEATACECSYEDFSAPIVIDYFDLKGIHARCLIRENRVCKLLSPNATCSKQHEDLSAGVLIVK